MTDTLFITLRPIEKYALFLFTFLPGEHDPSDLFRMMSKKVKGGDPFSVKNLCRQLAGRGLLQRCGQNAAEYVLATSFDLDHLRDLVRYADEGRWWPTADEIDAMFEHDGWRSGRLPGYIRSRGASDCDYAQMRLVRELALGPTGRTDVIVSRAVKSANRGRLGAAVAEWVRKILNPEPDFASFAWSDWMAALMPAWLSLGLMTGEDRTAAMDYVEAHYRELQGPSVALRRVFGAMSVWCGDRARIERSVDDGTYAEISAPLLYAAGGSFANADKQLVWVDSGTARERDDEYGEAAAWQFLLPFVAAAVKPEKVPRTRPISLFRIICGAGDTYATAFQPHNQFRVRVRLSAMRCVSEWKNALDGKGTVLAHCPQPEALSAVELLLAALDYRFLPVGRTARRPLAEKLAERARVFAENGYALVALSALTLLKGGYDADAYAPLVGKLSGRSFPFLPVSEPEPEWKNALALLEKSLPKGGAPCAASPDRRMTLYWYVSLERTRNGTLTVEDVFPAVRPAGGSKDGHQDYVTEPYAFNVSRYRAIMSEKDCLLAMTLQAEDGEPTSEVIDCLCGMENLLRADGYDYYTERRRGRKDGLKPMAVERGECRLETNATESGGLILRVPAWLGDGAVDYTLDEVAPNRFEYVCVTKDVRKIVETFGGFGPDRRLVIPSEAMREAEPVLARLGEVMPFAERQVADQESLPRVKADAMVVARLIYADGVLDVRAAVRLLADNPAMTCEPGVGNAEKYVVGATGSYVLVRDLAAEREGLARVRGALAGSETWFDGKCGWKFDDLEAALSALAALKGAEPPVALEWPDQRRLRLSHAPKSGVQLTSTRTAEDWFRVNGEFKLDDGRVLGIVELIEAAKSRTGNFVRLSDGDYLALTQTMARELDALSAAGRRKGDALEIVKAAVPMLDGVFGSSPESLALPDALAKTAGEIREALAKRPAVPRTLAAELRPYQKEGYRWLSRLAACGFGSCLADDMGLGKTLQVLTLLLERAADGASLVVAPSSVCGNWRGEIRRFAPTLSPVLAQETADWNAAAAGSVVIVSYGYLLFHADDFAAVSWNGLVLDEAQAIKNDAAKRAKCVKRLTARFRIAATGTPVENRLGELWSLMDFLNPGLLGSAAGFASRFTADGKATAELKRLVKPLILRRLKGEVLEDLPPKTEITLPIALGTAERTAYEGCRRHALAVLAEQGEGADGPNRMSILAELTRLRRFCCHPSLVLPGEGIPSAKLEALVELLGGLREGRHRALVFSQFTDYLAIVRKALDARGWSHLYLDGGTPTLERGELVGRFQGGEGDFFLISLKAGGTGLNLTAADYVILLDPWWNPAVENQAADRAHRIGQLKPVTIYRLIASDTVEERVIELHREKKEIAEDVLDGTSSAALTPAQLMRLFG